jgi:hypothetical protein
MLGSPVLFKDVTYPPAFLRFLSGISFLNLELLRFFNLGCLVDADFYFGLLTYTLVPIGIIIVLVGYYCLFPKHLLHSGLVGS